MTTEPQGDLQKRKNFKKEIYKSEGIIKVRKIILLEYKKVGCISLAREVRT